MYLMLLQRNRSTSNILYRSLSEIGLFTLHNCCVLCSLDYIEDHYLSLIVVFLFQSFLVLTVVMNKIVTTEKYGNGIRLRGCKFKK